MATCTKCGYPTHPLTEYAIPNEVYAQLANAATMPKLSQMDAEISCIDIIINDLRRMRASRTQTRNQHTLISSLPNEILAEIFVATLETGPSAGLDARSEPTMMPLILGKVCTEWRTVAWSLSKLWASVHCKVSKKKCAKQAELLAEWLARANNRPLSILISFEDEDVWTSPNVSTAIIDALVPCCHQWQHVALVLPEAWYTKLSSVCGKLESLETIFMRPPGLVFIAKPIDVFLDAPLLRETHISHYYLHDVSLPWCQITTASLGTASTDEALEFLARCPNLTSCCFTDLNPIEEQFPIAHLIHPTLQALSITLDPTNLALDPLLDMLTVTSLRNLSLTLPKVHDNPMQLIDELIERSGCPLTVVEVTGPNIPEQDIILFLSHTKSVSRMTNNIVRPDASVQAVNT